MKKFLLILSVLVIISAIIFRLYSDKIIPKQSANIPVKVSLTWLHNAQFAGMYVAKEKGFYRSADLNPTFIAYDYANNQIEMLNSGQVDFAIINSSELLKAIDKGIDVKAIAVIYENSPYSVISLKESNINSPADFVNKTLAAKGGNEEASILYDILLKEFNIDKSKVKFASPTFDTTEIEDLTSKKVDVIDIFRTDQLYLFNQQGIEYTLIKPELFGYQSYGDILITTNKKIKDNPQIVANFVKATLDGWKYALDNQNEAVDLTMKYVVDEQYKDKDYQKFILSQSEPLIRSSKGKQIGNMNYLTWRKLFDYFFKNGIIKNNLDINNLYTTEFVQ